jgi:hypothetical protein
MALSVDETLLVVWKYIVVFNTENFRLRREHIYQSMIRHFSLRNWHYCF